MYIHEREGWPSLTWDQPSLGALLTEVRHQQGRLLGRMEELGFPTREEATLRTLTLDVVKTSEIEGEKLDLDQVRSSVAKRMGLDAGALPHIDRNVEGIVEVILDATRNYGDPLTEKRLLGWHAALFPNTRGGRHRISGGQWRTEASGPMQVVSGPYGRETVHFEAPTFERLPEEMAQFIKWSNAAPTADLVIESALAHFWFVTVHPFEDGNGRIARAIADLFLARSEESSQRFFSMSAQIQIERKSYYEILERCQKGGLDVTLWMEWYLECLKRAISSAARTLDSVLQKTRFWRAHAGESLNVRQKTIINLLLDRFEGKLTTSKWAMLTKCSQDTALRDISDLLDRKILVKDSAGGRSTSYSICLPTAAG